MMQKALAFDAEFFSFAIVTYCAGVRITTEFNAERKKNCL